MTGLLVSVRNGVEARMALAAGVDLIDVKEPLRVPWEPPIRVQSPRCAAKLTARFR